MLRKDGARRSLSAEARGVPGQQECTFHGVDMVRIKEGQVVEAWHHGDDAVLLM